MKKIISVILILALVNSMGLHSFAMGLRSLSESPQYGNLISSDVYHEVGLRESLYDTTFNGQPASRKIIESLTGTVLFDAIVTEQGNIRTVYIMQEDTVVSQSSTTMMENQIPDGGIVPFASPPSDYHLIMVVKHPSVNIIGNLYGKHLPLSYSDLYQFNWSAGASFGIISGAFISKFGKNFSVVGLLVSLGVSVVGGVIDGVLAGKVRYKYDVWKYEVYANSKLGLRSEKTDVYQEVYSSTGSYVESIFIYKDGDSRSLEDICIAGAYYVYIGAV